MALNGLFCAEVLLGNYSLACLLSCRLLENEIQQLKKDTAVREKELCQQIEQLKKENHRQQKLIVQVPHCLLSRYI